MNQPQASPARPRTLTSIMLALAIAMTALAGCGGGGGAPSAPQYRSYASDAGSTKIGLNDPLVRALGRLEGPYVFIKSLSPSVVQLAAVPSGKAELVSMIGLSEETYPPAPADKDHPDAAKEDDATKERKRGEAKAFKIAGFKKLFDPAPGQSGAAQLWIIRMTKPGPKTISKVLIFQPDAVQMPGKPLTGEATLINALALRRGIYNMDFTNPAIMAMPLADVLLNCQLAAIIDSRRQKFGGNDIWTKYPMQLPKGPMQDKLAELEKTM